MFTIRNLKNQLIDLLRALKSGDYFAIIMILVSAFIFFIGLFFVIPIVLILWILKPVFWLKVGKLHYERLGDFALQTDLFLRRRQLGIHPDGPFYCFISSPKNLSNRQLLTMFKRVVPIFESRILFWFFCGMLPIFKRTPFYQDLPMNSNEYYEFNNAKPSLYFTPDEIKKGRKLLKQLNIDLDKDEFVCIFARDNAYLKHAYPHTNWDYQNARNSDIDSLIETAKYLIEKGFTVIRVGSIVNKPIKLFHEKMIDYPYSGHQNDFLDIFFQAYCNFVVSAGSSGGIDVSSIFDTPKLIVNLAELYSCPMGKNGLYTPKKYKYSNTNDYLRFKDALKLGNFWHNPANFGLETEEASSQEILEATEEMLARVEGRFRYSPESEKLIQTYHKLWGKLDHQGRSNKTPIGIAWLKKNRALYL